MSQKPSIPKGTRDFSPTEMVKRNYIFDTIKKVFQRYGYLPIETPAMENIKTLLGKYGEEGDKLIFRITESGDLLKGKEIPFKLRFNPENEIYFKEERKVLWDEIANTSGTTTWAISNELIPNIVDKALRYDLTVPFARYVVQHQHEITFPFKRYQIQPVWRADRPQKGRYREFYQCDADVIGSNSLLNEVELIQMMDDVFTSLKLPVIIKINNRKILQGLCISIGEEKRMIDVTVALDKYDKIGEEIYVELEQKDFEKTSINKLKSFIDRFLPLEDDKKIHFLKDILKDIEVGMKGVEEILSITDKIKELNKVFGNPLFSRVELDLALARGLNYYTGAIIEVKVDNTRCKSESTSSITGGGRYDDLTGIFGLPNMSGVGISFGADRIYDVMEELNIFPDEVAATTKLLFVTFGEKEQAYCLPLLAAVRKAGINSEMYPDASAKMKKQMSYADAKKIPFVVIVGGDEMNSGLLTLKNMVSGEQEKLSIENIINKLK